MSSMPRIHAEDAGRLLLRLAVGGLMAFHGLHKARHGVDGIGRMLTEHGLPAVLAYGALVGEVLAPVGLVLGVATRTSAALVAVTMLFAIGLAHAQDVWSTSARTGAYALELQALYLLAALSIVALGPGRLALHPRG